MKQHPAFGGHPGDDVARNSVFYVWHYQLQSRLLVSPFFVVRMKNMFLFDEARAKEQFFYRTVMVNWLYTSNLTYRQMAKTSKQAWDMYYNYEDAPGFGIKDPSESPSVW
jgi:hypothetical protein